MAQYGWNSFDLVSGVVVVVLGLGRARVEAGWRAPAGACQVPGLACAGLLNGQVCGRHYGRVWVRGREGCVELGDF
jgi:hypothetical protein